MTQPKFTWSRTKGYECSSKGDKRFSPFFCYMKDGRSIEAVYQNDVKGLCIGGKDWKTGKGNPPVEGVTEEDLWNGFLALWKEYLSDKEELLDELREHAIMNNYTLMDRFATTNINQARALAFILNEKYGLS